MILSQEKILLYHAICEDRDFPSAALTNVMQAAFEEQLDYLGRNYNLLPLAELLASGGEGTEKAAAVTFDDGYGDNFRTAYPILKRRGIPVTFFLTVSLIGKDWDFPGGPYPGLKWEEIREMNQDPLFNFASHGMRHLDLTRLSLKEAAAEAQNSKLILEEKLGTTVRFFSYPHGSFNDRVKNLVCQTGYRSAFSVISRNRDEYSLRRILISCKDNMFRFRLKLSPLYWSLRRIF